MSADIMGALPAHPRTALRQAVGALIEAAGFSGRVYLNPEEPWDAPAFPSVGVYVMSEQAAERDLSPRPDSREAELAVDILEAVRGHGQWRNHRGLPHAHVYGILPDAAA